jgi:hypothetical protein
MKIMKCLFLKILFYICLLGTVGFVLFSLPFETTLPERVKILSYLKYFVSAIGILGIIMMISDVVFGVWYQKITHVPMKELKIEVFDNLYLVRYRNKAFAIASFNKLWLKKETITVIDYYDRKKKHVSWRIFLPYMRSH